MSSGATWLRAAALAALAAQSAAQQCYYPNGNTAPDTEKPCSSAEGSACCPDNWQCLDNGLCHYPAEDLYGRYSCTDRDWNSPGCPRNLCTYDMSAFGGESITQCSNHNNDWCCNADAIHVDCCAESPAPRPFFALQDGRAYATIGSNTASSVPTVSSITGLASGSRSASSTGSAASSAGSRSPSATANSASTTRTPFTSVSTSVSSGTAGVSTIVITAVITPSSDPTTDTNTDDPSQSGSGSSNTGLIVGCAVGIPLALALIGVLFWLLRKRRNSKANPYKESSDIDAESPSSPGFAGGAAAKLSKDQKFRQSRPGTAEIDGNPVGAGRPISVVPGSAELPSGSGFQPGQSAPYGPDGVGIGGGTMDRNTWGSGPPQYSPAHHQTAFPTNAVELDGTSAMPVIDEKQQYEAYRPPQEAAELPTVKTPPEDVEKQVPR